MIFLNNAGSAECGHSRLKNFIHSRSAANLASPSATYAALRFSGRPNRSMDTLSQHRRPREASADLCRNVFEWSVLGSS